MQVAGRANKNLGVRAELSPEVRLQRCDDDERSGRSGDTGGEQRDDAALVLGVGGGVILSVTVEGRVQLRADGEHHEQQHQRRCTERQEATERMER